MPYKKTITYNIQQRQFSVLLKVHWSITSGHLEELKQCFWAALQESLDNIDRITLRIYRANSICRLTVIFNCWQNKAENIGQQIQDIAQKVIKNYNVC